MSRSVMMVPVGNGVVPPRLRKGRRRLRQGEMSYDYIRTTGLIPPEWSEEKRSRWECMRDDQLVLVRRQWEPGKQESAMRWLLRHGLDDRGRYRPEFKRRRR